MSVRILQLADAHLGAALANFGEYAERRREEQRAAFRKAIDVALEEHVQVVLIAGDLFDTFQPDPASVNLVRGELARLSEAGIKAIGVPGTHDSLAYSDCVYRKEDLGFHHFFTEPSFGQPVVLEIEGRRVAIQGIAYDPDHSDQGWSSLTRDGADDTVDIALAHAACQRNPDWPMRPEDLPFREHELADLEMDYIALGHYHNYSEFRHDDQVIAAYSGSLEGRDWTETGPRHVLIVEWPASRRHPDLKPVSVESRQLASIDVDVTGMGDLEAIADEVKSICEAGPLWQVTLIGEPDIVPDAKALQAVLEPVYDAIRVKDGTTIIASHLLSDRIEEETVRGEFFRRLTKAREGAATEPQRQIAERAIKLGLKVFG